ncbi:MAG: hypothetical protein JSW55_04495 [Chloroflexota bacterium]|nr:MAG: hypothetical protein JSW55_04495 [Chloroflexota bacterium]
MNKSSAMRLTAAGRAINLPGCRSAAPVVNQGAISAGDALETSTVFVEGMVTAGQRTIVQGWDEDMKRLSRPLTIYSAGSLPHG